MRVSHTGVNPAEFVMSASGGGLLTRSGLRREAEELAQLYRESDLFTQFNENMDTVRRRRGSLHTYIQHTFTHIYTHTHSHTHRR